MPFSLEFHSELFPRLKSERGCPRRESCSYLLQPSSEDHSCEGTNGWDTPACESAWQPNISAVFLGLVTNGEEEGVPIILNGEKAMTSGLHAIFKVVEAFRGVSVGTTTVISGGDLCGFPFSKGHRYSVYGRLLSNGEV